MEDFHDLDFTSKLIFSIFRTVKDSRFKFSAQLLLDMTIKKNLKRFDLVATILYGLAHLTYKGKNRFCYFYREKKKV